MADTYQTIEITRQQGSATLWLNRPGVHNAFNATMISELSRAVSELGSDKSARIVIIRGRGKSFCSGADIKWMKEGAGQTARQNYEEAQMLSDCFRLIYNLPKPVIAVVHGASTGGANGIVAASDIAICSDDAVFSLSEVRIGLVPSVISPWVIRRIGEFRARELMLTAARIYGSEAAAIGLVNRSCQLRELDQVLDDLIGRLLEAGPEALVLCKELIIHVCNIPGNGERDKYTAEMLAGLRVSGEGQEGMAAFLEKRKPRWTGTAGYEH